MKKIERKQAKSKIRSSTQEIMGSIIAELRKKADLTQEDLAYDCGIDRSFMSKIEKGLTSISVVTLFQLAEGLKVKPSEIIQQLEEKNFNQK